METLTLNALLAGFGRMSLEAGVLVVLVLLAQGLFRRQLTPRWRCALWLLVVARLLLPVSFTSAASLFNLLPAWTNHAAARSAPVIVAVAASPVPAAAPAQVAATTAPTRPPPSQTVQIHGNAESDTAFPSSAVSQPPQPPRADAGPAARPSAISWVAVLFGAWLAGALVLAAHVGFTSVRLARRIAKLPAIYDPSVQAVLDECRRLVGVATPLDVVATDQVAGPALHGLWRPRLLLPRRCLADFSPGELRFIFLHELAHLKRRDLPLNWLVALLQVAHWFNPLLWLGFARWRADRELACDALALEAAGAGQNRDYGRTILRLLEGFTQRAAAPGLVGILEDKRQLRRRIQMIATYVPTRRWTILAVVLMVALAVTGLTDAQNRAPVTGQAKDKFSGASSVETQSSTKPALPSRPLVTNGPAMKVMVLDKETGRPLPDAEVLAPNFASFYGGSENAPRWTTDADGAAVIRLGEVPPNHLREISWFAVSIRHAGYSPRGLSWSAENKDVRPDMPREVAVRLERGITLGGVVRDEAGVALAGIRVRIFACGYRYDRWRDRHQEYAEFWNDSAGDSLAVTDAQGRWQVKDFPRGLENVALQFIRPDGAVQTFKNTAEEFNPISNVQGESFDLAGLRAGDAAFVLKSGLQLHGIVLDPEGRPLPAVLVKTGMGAVNMRRLHELHTDTAGRFELSHLTRGQVILTAYPKDFAVTTTIADVATNAPEVRLQVAPLRPLRVRVLDGAGQAVAGAKLSLDGYRSEGQVLDFSGIADQEGRLTWSNAPVSSFALVAQSPTSEVHQKMRLSPEQREVTFRLRKGMEEAVNVSGRAHDAKTGAVVELESVRYQTGDREGFPFEGEILGSGFRMTVPATRFRPGGSYPTFQLEIQAKGYGTLFTPWWDFDEGDWEPDFSLHPASESGVTLSLPEGQPAAGARGWTFFDEGIGSLFCNSPNQFYGHGFIKVQADANGQIELPTVPDDRPVVFTHPDGFLETSIAEARRSRAVRLQPWGQVEGVLKVAGQPKADARVSLSTLVWSPSAGILVLYSTATTADGRFFFTNVPAGEYKLSREAGPTKSGRLITESYQMPITVKAGETLTVTYAGEGRAVIGQAQADPPDAAVDWFNDDHVLVLKQPPLPEVKLEDFATTEAFQKVRIASYASPARLQQAREARTYQLEFQSDGSFRADDVPPGKYELRIRVTKPGKNRQFSPFPRPEDELGSLVREVVVPPGHGPFDLGTLTVPIKAGADTPRTAPLELSAQTLDGQPVSLTQFRGKHVLMVFWAAWSERSLDALAELQKLENRFAQDGRLALLGVNVGDESATARKVVEAGGYHWTQARLTDAERAKVTAAFDVNTLPAVLLLDPIGRLVGRDLEGERLQTAVRRALSKR